MPIGGEVIEVPPTHCPAGHELLPGRTTLGSQHCSCSGVRDDFRAGGVHRTYFCCVEGCPDPLIVTAPRCTEPSRHYHGLVGVAGTGRAQPPKG